MTLTEVGTEEVNAMAIGWIARPRAETFAAPIVGRVSMGPMRRCGFDTTQSQKRELVVGTAHTLAHTRTHASGRQRREKPTTIPFHQSTVHKRTVPLGGKLWT